MTLGTVWAALKKLLPKGTTTTQAVQQTVTVAPPPAPAPGIHITGVEAYPPGSTVVVRIDLGDGQVFSLPSNTVVHTDRGPAALLPPGTIIGQGGMVFGPPQLEATGTVQSRPDDHIS